MVSRESYDPCTCHIDGFDRCSCFEDPSDLIQKDHLCFSNLSNTLNNSFIYFQDTDRNITLIGRTKIILFEASK